MTITPRVIDDELRRLAHKLESRTDDLAELFNAASEAEAAYRVAFAKALLRSEEKTVARQEADALLKCERLFIDRKCKEAVADAGRESVRSMRDQITAVQSVGANMRAEMSLAGRAS